MGEQVDMAGFPTDAYDQLCEAVKAIKQAAITYGVNDQVGEAIAHAEVVMRLDGTKTHERTESDQCRCWNEGEWGRVHREDCPIHRDQELWTTAGEFREKMKKEEELYDTHSWLYGRTVYCTSCGASPSEGRKRACHGR